MSGTAHHEGLHEASAHPLFFIGNKRSGTSHLVSMLNAWGNVFVCPEADLLWILFQAQSGVEITCHPEDGDGGMLVTLEHCRELLFDSGLPVHERFLAMAGRIRAVKGGPNIPGKRLLWIGDKKPVQHADPRMRDFLYEHFPNAKCLHLIRHPTAVINSMRDQAVGKMSWMECWKGSPEHLLERWCEHERWVLNMKGDGRLPILTIRYTDLTGEPERIYKTLKEFLKVPVDEAVIQRCVALTRSNSNTKYRNDSLSLSKDALGLVDHYGLKL